MSRANFHVSYPWEISEDLVFSVQCKRHPGNSKETADQSVDLGAALVLEDSPDSSHELEITLRAKDGGSISHRLKSLVAPPLATQVSARLTSDSSRSALSTKLGIGGGGYTGTLQLKAGALRGLASLSVRIYRCEASPGGSRGRQATAAKALVAWSPTMSVIVDRPIVLGKGIETRWVDFSSCGDTLLEQNDSAYASVTRVLDDEGRWKPVLRLNESAELNPQFKLIMNSRSTNDTKRRIRDLLYHEVAVVGWSALVSSALIQLARLMTSGSVDVTSDDWTWESAAAALDPLDSRVLAIWAPLLHPEVDDPFRELCEQVSDPENWREYLLIRIPLATQHREGSRDLDRAIETLIEKS